jgi:hypothetical protein
MSLIFLLERKEGRQVVNKNQSKLNRAVPQLVRVMVRVRVREKICVKKN